jgi:hypothetical protein
MSAAVIPPAGRQTPMEARVAMKRDVITSSDIARRHDRPRLDKVFQSLSDSVKYQTPQLTETRQFRTKNHPVIRREPF